MHFGTNTGQVFGSRDGGDSWALVADYLPPVLSVETAILERYGRVAMVRVVLPASLVELFPGAPRRLELEATTVGEVIDRLDERWPGMRNRICDTSRTIRRHITIFVDADRGELGTEVPQGAEVRVIPAVSGG